MRGTTDTKTEPTETQRVLADMLTENTGRHMLDSGGAYGRAWERNQADVAANGTAVEHFERQPEATWDWGPTVSVYHFLKERLEYAPKFDRAWRTFVMIGPDGYGDDVRYYNGLGTGEEFLEQLEAKTTRELHADGEPLGLSYLEADAEFAQMSWVNTYNGEDTLSQVIQYKLFAASEHCPFADQGEGYYVLLSIHGGCDVRGGYTDLRVFWVGDYDAVCSLLDNARVELWCENEECPGDGEYKTKNWMSDDAGSNWYFDGSSGGPEPVFNEEERGKSPVCPFCAHELTVGMYPAY